MRKWISLLSFCVFSLLIIPGCFEKKNLAPDDWLGRYTYREPEVNGIITSWEIMVSKMNGSFYPIINASSVQGNFSYSCEIKTVKNNLFVLFEKSLSKTTGTFNKGDTLVTLQKNSGEIKTTWNKLHPATFTEDKNPCDCFSFRGKNENDNEISLP